MSLTAAIHIGRSALAASQLGIQIAGNNMANAATPGYSRQVGRLVPLRGDLSIRGISIGAGVSVHSVQRQVDSALQSRLWYAASDQAGAQAQARIFENIEATLGELTDQDLSSELSAFFRAWSERSNQTQASGAVIEQGDKMASFIRRMRSDLVDERRQIDREIAAGVDYANQLLTTIAGLNGAIADTEVSGATANTLRDQRDLAVTELSSMMDVTVVDRGREGVDVLAGSVPVVLGGQARGLDLRSETVNGEVRLSVATVAGGAELSIASGRIGALLSSRSTAVAGTLDQLDTLASQIIFEVNKLHSTGVNQNGLLSTTGTLQFTALDRSRSLNDPANAATNDLPFQAVNGGFMVNVRERTTGAITSVRINVDLDGIDAAGAAGFGDDTSVEDIQAALAAVPGLTATFTPDGRLSVTAAQGFDFSFSDDSSGAAAVLGLNAYFTGTDASDIAVRSDLKADSSLLTTGRMIGGQFVENGTALAIAGLQNTGLTALNGKSIPDLWRDTAQSVGADAATSRSASDAAGIVRESLEAQRAAISGVSTDEEAINLMDFQRQYQGAARLISVVDELTQTLLSLV